MGCILRSGVSISHPLILLSNCSKIKILTTTVRACFTASHLSQLRHNRLLNSVNYKSPFRFTAYLASRTFRTSSEVSSKGGMSYLSMASCLTNTAGVDVPVCAPPRLLLVLLQPAIPKADQRFQGRRRHRISCPTVSLSLGQLWGAVLIVLQ